MIRRNSNRKLTLEQRITRLENAIKSNRRSVRRKFESMNDDAAYLEDYLSSGTPDVVVTAMGNSSISVEFDAEYFGTYRYLVTKDARGYKVEDDSYGSVDHFDTIEDVAAYIDSEAEQAALDL